MQSGFQLDFIPQSQSDVTPGHLLTSYRKTYPSVGSTGDRCAVMVSENVILRSNGPAHHRPFSEVQNKVSATLQEKNQNSTMTLSLQP